MNVAISFWRDRFRFDYVERHSCPLLLTMIPGRTDRRIQPQSDDIVSPRFS